MVNFLRQVITFTLMWLMFKDVLTVGQLISLQFYSFFIFGPLQEIGSIIFSYREAEASLANFHNLMLKKVEPKPLNPNWWACGRIRIQKCSFQTPDCHYKALDGISFDVKRGETIAFVGPSGAGKSTLVKLLVGLYRTNQGSIVYNGSRWQRVGF